VRTQPNEASPDFYDLSPVPKKDIEINTISVNGKVKKSGMQENCNGLALGSKEAIVIRPSPSPKLPSTRTKETVNYANSTSSKRTSEASSKTSCGDLTTIRFPPDRSTASLEDEEVNRITSCSSIMTSECPSASPTSTLSSDKKRNRFADSGIQQDLLERPSDDPLRRRSHQSIDSMEGRKNENSEKNLKSAYHLNRPKQSETRNHSSKELKPSRVSEAALKSSDKKIKPGIDPLQNWTPDFQPLSSVFNEIAKMGVDSPHQHQPKKSRSSPVDSNITVKHYQEGTLPRKNKRDRVIPGLLPRTNSMYRPNPVHPPSATVRGYPPSYSFVVSSRDNGGPGVISQTMSNRNTLGKHRHHSPSAMSPSLSPSLAPLTARTPTSNRTQLFGDRDSLTSQASSGKRTRSDESTLSNDLPERMVLV